MKQIRNNIKSGMRWGMALAAIAATASLAGCSSIVDSPQQKSPEPTIRNYYFQMAQPHLQYQFAVRSANDFQPASDLLVMDMQGRDMDDTDHVNGSPVYSCNWSYATAGNSAMWYYAFDDTQAIDLGVEYNGRYTDSWVDLKAPLDVNKSWTFISKGETITATIVKYGGSAAVGGKNYDDVIEVNYSGAKGTTGTAWFSRGIGEIFTHIERPGNVMFDAQFQSMAQK